MRVEAINFHCTKWSSTNEIAELVTLYFLPLKVDLHGATVNGQPHSARDQLGQRHIGSKWINVSREGLQTNLLCMSKLYNPKTIKSQT